MSLPRTASWCPGVGLAFGSFGEFAAALDLLLARPDQRRALGASGRAYVRATCEWSEVARSTASFVLGTPFA